MSDIQTRADLEFLLSEFYSTLLKDETMRHIFLDVAQINLAEHLATITDFWEQTIFHTGGYRNNVLQIHSDLNQKETLRPEHFQIWLRHFNATVDNHFSGENSEKAKTRALSIGTIMQIKIGQ